jgi:hypothetical protein
MLLDWGTRQADRARLPAFLESSPMGKPLYERMGFQAKEGKSQTNQLPSGLSLTLCFRHCSGNVGSDTLWVRRYRLQHSDASGAHFVEVSGFCSTNNAKKATIRFLTVSTGDASHVLLTPPVLSQT